MAQNSDKVAVFGEFKPTWRPQTHENEKTTRQQVDERPFGLEKATCSAFP